MTPKEKAQELIHQFAKPIDTLHKYPMCYETSKQCALIAVDEIDLLLQKSTPKDDPYCNLFALEYWQEVKKEIERVDKIPTVNSKSKEIVNYHFSMGEEISETELNDIINKKL